jgi:hypothetical protein
MVMAFLLKKICLLDPMRNRCLRASNFSPPRLRSDNHILTRLALTWIKPVGMSALGQKRTFALQ